MSYLYEFKLRHSSYSLLKQMSSTTMVGVGLGRPVGNGMADHLMGRPGAVASDLISGRNISLVQLPVDAISRLAPGRETDVKQLLYPQMLPTLYT